MSKKPRAIEFAVKLKNFSKSTKATVTAARLIAQREVVRSIKRGSEITGAPGQPVDTSALLNGWIESRPGPALWEFSTDLEYAEYIEDGGNDIGPFTLRSEVGGFHSVKLTEASWKEVVEYARQEAQRRGFRQ
jgi:hypothetical protein